MSDVVMVRMALVSTLRTVTVAPATIAPVASVTVPVIEPVIPWARAPGARASMSSKLAKRAEYAMRDFACSVPHPFVNLCANNFITASKFVILKKR
jgi:hypothetical protein